MIRRICLIEPPYDVFMEELDPPFPLMYLAAVAEKVGWEAKIIDMENLDDEIPEADVYGVTSTSPQWPTTRLLSYRLQHQYPNKSMIIGGTHISSCPEDFRNSGFTTGVLGEGDITLGKMLTTSSFPKQLIHGEPVFDLDSVPFPARHLIEWQKYKRGIYCGNHRLADAVSIISSRGCVYNCIFCGSHVVFGRHVKFRSVENVIAEIKQVIETMGYRGMNFHDDTFCINRSRVIELCKEFMKLDIVWRCLSRADTIDSDLLSIMKEAGCKEIILGVESGSQKILDMLNKGTSVKQNLNAMKFIKESGIQLKVGIIVGSPGETWETVKETEALLKECPPDFWNVSVFTPFPGCSAWSNPEKYGLKILTRDLSQYSMVGKARKGNVVIETKDMNKSDIEQARDELIDLCLEISPQ